MCVCVCVCVYKLQPCSVPRFLGRTCERLKLLLKNGCNSNAAEGSVSGCPQCPSLFSNKRGSSTALQIITRTTQEKNTQVCVCIFLFQYLPPLVFRVPFSTWRRMPRVLHRPVFLCEGWWRVGDRQQHKDLFSILQPAGTREEAGQVFARCLTGQCKREKKCACVCVCVYVCVCVCVCANSEGGY